MEKILQTQREYFQTGATRPASARREALDRLRRGIKQHEQALLEALKEDLGKSATEAYMTEIGLALSEIRYVERHLKRWMRPQRKASPLTNFPARSKVTCEPYGVVLIIAPWNYPFLLLISPLIGALAAGNCCVLKPSELAPATAAAVTRMMEETFPREYVTIVNGGVEESQALLDQDFDYIFYTGSPAVGRIVMEKAARHLTPVTLELGGKSPVVVTRSANLRTAARRIVFGKFLNAGQTCIAPDYVLCEQSVHEPFVRMLREELTTMYGPRPLDNPDYGKIINRRHFDRLCLLMDKAKVVAGGETQPERLRIAPTILTGVVPTDDVMQEEIFGPLLPVLSVRDDEEAFRFIQARPHPLALYLFTSDKAVEKRFMTGLEFGGGCVNDVISHIVPHNLPFGGVGQSGMGAYHGHDSFLTFSHRKAIVRRGTWPDIPLRYPPYREWKERAVRWILKFIV